MKKYVARFGYFLTTKSIKVPKKRLTEHKVGGIIILRICIILILKI